LLGVKEGEERKGVAERPPAVALLWRSSVWFCRGDTVATAEHL
jgi:hypothetical protein